MARGDGATRARVSLRSVPSAQTQGSLPLSLSLSDATRTCPALPSLPYLLGAGVAAVSAAGLKMLMALEPEPVTR